MDIAITLVVNPDSATSLSKAETIAAKAAHPAQRTDIVNLAKDIACDLIIEAPSADDIRADIANDLNEIEGLDWAVQPAEGRKKKLILADMDSTIITVECIDELADFIGLKDQVSAITEAAMRGELDFEGALTERVALLSGLTEVQLKNCYDDRIQLMSGAQTLIRTMTANGAYSALVSGGFTYFTEQVAKQAGFHMNRANVLEIKNGALTGRVLPPICGAQTKLAALHELTAKQGLLKSDVLAVGDGANDIPMIDAAGFGVAYQAHPKTRSAADAAVRYNDLTALLYFQGYKVEEFAA